MGKTLDFLTPAWLDRRQGTPKQQAKVARIMAERFPPETDAELRKMFRGPMLENGEIASPNRAGGVDDAMEKAALHFIRGDGADAARASYHELATRWVPIIEAMDFTRREITWDELTPKSAEQLIAEYGGRMTKQGATRTVKSKVMPQPLVHDVEKVLMAAAISGDRSLARKLARGYPVPKVVPKVTAQFEIRFRALRHVLADDRRAADEAAEHLEDGYPTDFPPDRIELPLGVLRTDPALLATGMKRITTRFAGMWDVDRVRKWYDKRVVAAKSRGRAMPPFEKQLDLERANLIGLKWLLSTWALAFLSAARWRGITAPFDQAKLFSEWIPLELCS